MWAAFEGWVACHHANNLGRTYDSNGSSPLLDEASVALWGQYADEFAASPEAEEERLKMRYIAQAYPICMAAKPSFVRAVADFPLSGDWSLEEEAA
jgi:hypothetical protein